MADFYYDLAALLFENPDFRRAAIAHLNDVEMQERAEALLERLSDLEEAADDLIDQIDIEEDEEDEEIFVTCDDPSCRECSDVSDDEVLDAEEELWTSSSDVWTL